MVHHPIIDIDERVTPPFLDYSSSVFFLGWGQHFSAVLAAAWLFKSTRLPKPHGLSVFFKHRELGTGAQHRSLTHITPLDHIGSCRNLRSKLVADPSSRQKKIQAHYWFKTSSFTTNGRQLRPSRHTRPTQSSRGIVQLTVCESDAAARRALGKWQQVGASSWVRGGGDSQKGV